MYPSQTKHNETKTWFRDLLCYPARERIRPIVQLPETAQGTE